MDIILLPFYILATLVYLAVTNLPLVIVVAIFLVAIFAYHEPSSSRQIEETERIRKKAEGNIDRLSDDYLKQVQRRTRR